MMAIDLMKKLNIRKDIFNYLVHTFKASRSKKVSTLKNPRSTKSPMNK